MRRNLLLTMVLTSVGLGTVQAQVLDQNAQWTWMSGRTVQTTRGSGTAGVENSSVNPHTMRSFAAWSDTVGNFWMYGGEFNTSRNVLSALWRYNKTTKNWMLVKGAMDPSGNGGFQQQGKFGTLGTPHPDNVPPGLNGITHWKDLQGKFWLFGGFGMTTSNNESTGAEFNTLWMYDPATNNWTWVSGASTTKSAGNYGPKGLPLSSNEPGARGKEGGYACAWVDKQGNFWIFGGRNPSDQRLNDFWKFDPVSKVWTLMGGSNVGNDLGSYGVRGVADPSNYPRARSGAAYWTDRDGKFWMFGGLGPNKAGTISDGRLNDLWMYDPDTDLWTWVHGTDEANQKGIYGVQGQPAPGNMPGGRFGTGAGENWVDVNGNLWLFGGNGWNASHNASILLDDVWRFDPVAKEWTWMKGSSSAANTVNPNYGVKETTAASNNPGSRYYHVGWRDADGNFWFYGGINVNARGDLWRLSQAPAPGAPAQPGPYTQGKRNVCAGEVVTFAVAPVNGATSYNWLYTGTGATFTATTTSPSNSFTFAANATPGLVRVRATNASGSSTYRDTTINIINPPTVTISSAAGRTSFCAGDSLQLSATASETVTYQWKLGAGNVGTGAATYYAKVGGNYTVTATSTSSGCASTSSAINLVANPLPNISVSPAGPLTLCQGDSVVLTASIASGMSYEWYNGNTVVGTNAATYAVQTAGSYSLRVTDLATNCVATTSPSVDVALAARPNQTVTPAGVHNICQGDTLQFTASASGSRIGYQWHNGSSLVQQGSVLKGYASGTYVATAVDSNSNCTDHDTVQLVVYSIPAINVTPAGPVAFCGDDSVILSVNVTGGLQYQWYRNNISVGSGSTLAAKSSGLYKVTATEPISGCSDSSQAVTVTGYAKPDATLIPTDTGFCEGNSTILQVVTQDTGLRFTWLNQNGSVIPFAEANFLEVQVAGTYRAVVQRNAMASCGDTTNAATIVVHSLPVVDIVWDGEVLHATPGFASYQWYNSAQPIPGATDSTFQPTNDGFYAVEVIDSNGCDARSSIHETRHVWVSVQQAEKEIRIYPNPSDGLIYLNSPLPISATISTLTGKTIFVGNNVTMIDLREFAAGMYLLQVTDDAGRILKVEKIVKSIR